MSRLLIAASLVAALSSLALADRAFAPHFAQPPDATHVYVGPAPGSNWVAPVLDRAHVRAALAHARAVNLAAFRAYQRAGVFPSNTYQDAKLNVWRDRDGHFCAAATIIKMSGQGNLVTRVADQNNFIRLADVRQGPLMDWILTSGFTQAEIAAIQEPFMPVRDHTAQPIAVDANLREKENERLQTKYRAVTRMLVVNEQASLDIAVDRLMARPQLAWNVLGAED